MEYEALDDFLYRQNWGTSFQDMLTEIQNFDNDSMLDLIGYAGDIFWKNIGAIKAELLQLFGICLLFSVVHQLALAYGKDQIEKYSYYIYFVCGATICLSLFLNGYETVYQTINQVLQFMELLLPCYSLAVIFSNGLSTSAAYYGIVLFVLFLAEMVIFSIFLPATKVYMAVRFVNEGIGDSIFSKSIKLFEDGISWGLKLILMLVCSINTLQGLLFPAIDKVRGMSIGKTIEMIPGIGKLAGSASEVILGTSTLLKNSIGIVAIVVLVALCAPAVIQLVALIVGLRILEAIIDPFFAKRLGCLLEVGYKSACMLLKIQFHVLALFSISLVILTGFS